MLTARSPEPKKDKEGFISVLLDDSKILFCTYACLNHPDVV